MKESNDKNQNPSVFLSVGTFLLFSLVFGALYGAVEAFLNLRSMKAIWPDRGLFSQAYSLWIGAAFFAQFFLCAGLGAWILKRLLSLVSDRFTRSSDRAWAMGSVVLTGVGLWLWVILNQWLPSIRSTKSLLGNGLFLLCYALALVLLGRIIPLKPRTNNERPVLVWAATGALQAAFLFSLLTATSASAIPATKGQPPTSVEKPNILMISIDTLRADHLSCYGYQGITTPHMDRLAAEGALFERTISQTSWTLPALATLHTGVLQEVHGMNRHDIGLDPTFETLAETLQKAGYTTLAVVTNEFVNHAYRLDQGFDRYVFSRDPEAYHPFAGLFLFDFLFSEANERHAAFSMTSRAIEWIRRAKDRPFFIWIHYIDPHSPYGAWYVDRFPEYDAGYRGELGREFHRFGEIDDGTFVPTEADKQHIMALYDAEIMHVDKNLGRLWKALEQMDLWDNTAIVLTSDHGEEFWDHGDIIHGRTLYTESVHVPLLIKFPPKIAPGTRVSKLAGLVDIPPAVCELTGTTPPSVYQGRSVLELLRGRPAQPVYVSLDKLPPQGEAFSSVGVYDPVSTYLGWTHPDKGEQLFDAQGDPKQMLEISEKKTEVLARLRQRVQTELEGCANLRSSLRLTGEGGKIELTPQMRQALRGLGYLN